MRGLARALGLVLVLGAGAAQAQQTYSQQATLAADVTFQARVKVAAVAAAISIANEAANTPNHAHRVALAIQVLDDPTAWAARLALGVTADTSITAGSSDATLSTRMAAVWDAFAGP